MVLIQDKSHTQKKIVVHVRDTLILKTFSNIPTDVAILHQIQTAFDTSHTRDDNRAHFFFFVALFTFVYNAIRPLVDQTRRSKCPAAAFFVRLRLLFCPSCVTAIVNRPLLFFIFARVALPFQFRRVSNGEQSGSRTGYCMRRFHRDNRHNRL